MEVKHPNGDPTEFENLVFALDRKHFDTVMQLIQWHNRRIKSGAVGDESYARLLDDMRDLLPKDTNANS